MRRRGVGVSAIAKRQEEAKQFHAIGKAMEEERIFSIKEVTMKFREKLVEFATKHRDRINSDPEFRLQFHKMCMSLGVDPLSSNKGFWADLLGVGNFYFDLGIQIIQICLKTRSQNGGLIHLSDLHTRVLQARDNNRGGASASVSKRGAIVTRDDLLRAIEKLTVLGGGFRLLEGKQKDRGDTLVVSVPMELNRDHQELIGAAQRSGGYVTAEQVNWSLERFNIAITPLLQDGIVWIDSFQGETLYWFTAIWDSLTDANNLSVASSLTELSLK